MAGPAGMRSGCGQAISPAAKPAGSVHSICGGSPESPGLVQYVCQPGAICWRRPIQNVCPGAIDACALTRSTVTFGGPVGTGAATADGVRTIAASPARISASR
jgi:hypothetical protein